MHPTEIEAFKTSIGLTKLPGADATDGVRADWQTLPAAIASHVKNLKLRLSEVIPLEPGLAQVDFTWKNETAFLDAWVFVSGMGPKQAREKLVSLASHTMMVKIPFERGPADLGDISVQGLTGPDATIIWTFRNVCVQVENEGTGVPVEPIARAIQRYMESHLVPNISAYLPKVDALDLAPRPIHVGDEVRLSVKLAKSTSPETLVTRIHQGNERLLMAKDIQALTGTYRAEHPGKSRIDVLLVDRKTLLSPPLSVSIEVLP